MNRKINIIIFYLLFFTSPLLISSGLVDVSIVATPLATKEMVFTNKDSLKVEKLACNFSPSLWLKADAGVTLSGGNVGTWADQSGNVNDAIQNTTSRRPSLLNESINFNPSIDFDGSNDFLQGLAGGANTTLFMVARSDLAVTNTTSGQTIFTTNITNPNSDSYFFSLGSVTAAYNNEVITHGLGNSSEYRKAYVGNTTISATPHLYSTDHINATSTANIYFDGNQIDNITSGNFINAETNRRYRVGGNLYVWGGTYFNGQIAEVLSFPTNLNLNDRHIISSYLGIKYGISLAHPYQSSADQIIWDEPGYTQNIAGIARDDCFGLNQKQTKNTQSGAIISMGLGIIATSNSANQNNFPLDQSFLLWGNDNDNNGVIEEINSELPIGVIKRLDREWKIRNINEVKSVEVEFDLNGIVHSGTNSGDFFLLLDDDGDGDFTSGNVQKIPATSFQNGIVNFDNIDFSDGQVFTLATATNNAPQIDCPEVFLEVCPNGNNYEFATGFRVVDIDNDNLSAQITILGITNNSDNISVDLTGFSGVNQSFTYPNLSITGTITPVQLQAILRTLRFSTTSNLVGTREINILVSDNIENSNAVIKKIQADENLSICCSANAPIIGND